MVRREEPPSYADCGRGVAFSYPPGKPHHQPVPAAHLFSVPPPVARLNPPTLYSNPAHRSQPITPAPCPPRSSSYPAGKPPTAPPANIPTSQQVEKPKSWHTKKPIHQEVGNLESWKTKKPRSRKPGKSANRHTLPLLAVAPTPKPPHSPQPETTAVTPPPRPPHPTQPETTEAAPTPEPPQLPKPKYHRSHHNPKPPKQQQQPTPKSLNAEPSRYIPRRNPEPISRGYYGKEPQPC